MQHPGGMAVGQQASADYGAKANIGYANSTLAAGQQGVNQGQRTPTASEIAVNEMNMMNDHLQNLSHRLYGFKSRMLGPSPEKEGPSPPRATGSGQLGALAEQFETMKGTIAALQTAMLEVERIG